jgi:ketosteroid isomerase-like protein
MKNAASIILLLTILLVGYVNVSAQDSTAAQQPSKASLEQAVNSFLDAVKTGNLEKVKSYYVSDYMFVGPDGKAVNADERLKQMAAVPAANRPSFADVIVRSYGAAGVSTGVSTAKDETGGNVQSRFSQTWVWQQPGRWALASSHVTRIAP